MERLKFSHRNQLGYFIIWFLPHRTEISILCSYSVCCFKGFCSLHLDTQGFVIYKPLCTCFSGVFWDPRKIALCHERSFSSSTKRWFSCSRFASNTVDGSVGCLIEISFLLLKIRFRLSISTLLGYYDDKKRVFIRFRKNTSKPTNARAFRVSICFSARMPYFAALESRSNCDDQKY